MVEPQIGAVAGRAGHSNPPLIGVCAAFETAQWSCWTQRAAVVADTYLTKIGDAGGLPIVLVPEPRSTAAPELLLDRIDALMLIGGVDLEPASYGSHRTARTEATAPMRDAFEIALARAALARDLPVLGICRGMQILNVATGGTLHQHLADRGYAEHRPQPGRLDDATFHDVDVAAGTLAAALCGAGTQRVNSHHHQGVAALGDGAVVTAHSTQDGLPEALEWPSQRYALGVQWHPESTSLQHALDEFVCAAARNIARNQHA